MTRKSIKRICKNCKLYDGPKAECAVVVLFEGEKIHLPTNPSDPCFFEQEYFDPTTKAMEDLNEIKEVKFWVENEKGEKIDGDGKVKIEYDKDFFGKDVTDFFGI